MFFDDAWTKYLAEVSSKKTASTPRHELAQDEPYVFSWQHVEGNMVAKFRDWRLGTVQAGTVIKDLNTVSHIFTTAIREWGVKAENPVLIIKKPKVPAGRLRFLTDGEIVKPLKKSRKAEKQKRTHLLCQC